MLQNIITIVSIFAVFDVSLRR